MENDNWGGLARLGAFVVGSEVVPEAEWWAMAPAGVSIHVARVTAPTPWAQWRADRSGVDLAPDLERGAAQFKSMRLSAAAIAHSSSSVAGGPGWDEAVIARLKPLLHETTAVTTSGLDCERALRRCGVARPFIVFPPWFREEGMRAGIDYFAARGFLEPQPFRHAPERRWDNVRPEDLYKNFMHVQQRADLLFEQIAANCPTTADGVLIVGTGLRCVGILDALEARLGRPVISANQASLWRCLSLARVTTPIAGYGQLLSGPRDHC
ncbi:MAG: hypothetical protein WD969_11225 [Paracoccaceae bacterium]